MYVEIFCPQHQNYEEVIEITINALDIVTKTKANCTIYQEQHNSMLKNYYHHKTGEK